jgi:hypothetical protein
MNNVAIVESCLLHGRYHGLLPMHIDVPPAAREMSKSLSEWSAAQKQEALTWCERICPVGTDPPPQHVATLLARTARDWKGSPA